MLDGFVAWLNTIEGFPGMVETDDPVFSDLALHFYGADDYLAFMGDNFIGTDGGVTFYLTHGHHASPDYLPPLEEGSIFLSGHTHVKMDEVRNGIRCLNPGSVSIPKEGSCHSYMTLEDGTFLWKNVETGEEYRSFTP